MPVTPYHCYQQSLQQRAFMPDATQAEAVRQLQAVYEALSNTKAAGTLPFLKWFSTEKKPVRGLYLWGGVGRGKTWLMDLFFDCLPFDNKVRMHFHHFMKHVHAELSTLSGQQNPLQLVARRLANKARIICFDEFFVSDITDAMVLGGLFEHLFKQGVTLVATSNVVPDELYKDGLQRARFLPAIDLLKQHTQVLNVDGGTDYRLRILQQEKTYYFPLNEETHHHLHDTFNQLSGRTDTHFQQPAASLQVDDHPHAGGSPQANGSQPKGFLAIEGRKIPYISEHSGVGHFAFKALCDGPRSQNDYIELACLFHTVLLEGLPQLSAFRDDQARRFISLVDEFYDRNVTLIIAAEVPMTDIYTGNRLAFEFQRTMSRLYEMQSTDYLAKPHIAG